MSRAEFQKSVRMFHKFSDETMRRRGGNQAGRESVVALAAIEAVLRGERLLDGSLLEPLAAFTNLLQSSQLPPEFGNFSFGDALLAVEDAHAEQRQNAAQRWEFEPEPPTDALALLAAFTRQEPPPSQGGEHGSKLRRFVLDAIPAGQTGSIVVSGALCCPELPLAELAQRCERLVLSDLDLPGLESLVRRAIPEEQRARVKLERYDSTGCRTAFARDVSAAVEGAADTAAAEAALVEVLQSYDVGAGSAGLSALEEKPDLAISAMQLSELGRGFALHCASSLLARKLDDGVLGRPTLAHALALFCRLVEQHHIQALLRRARSAVLISAVSEVSLRGPAGAEQPASEPRDLLGVERLAERLPQQAQIKAELSWEHRQPRAAAEKTSLVTLVEAVLV